MILGPSAIVDGRAALVLSHVLRGRLQHGLTLQRVLAEMGLSPVNQAAALAASAAIEEAGESWHILELVRKQTRKSEVIGSKPLARLDPMTTLEASRMLALSARRVRWLAAACVIPAEKVGRGYLLEHADVLAYRDARGAA